MKFQLIVVNLDSTVGSEINKTRPCLVISPDEMNLSLRTIVVAPLTSTVKAYLPTRIKITASAASGLNNDSYVALDQIKTIDKSRIVRFIGTISNSEQNAVTDALLEMFSF
ncbi:MAG: type II toxin-antitoxin system PemK/MazF family toxin [Bacteroides sp.]|nr:type II toxin-antitoxin system PemK/MazF family toxin [Bacteroides sp.]MCM1379625.1 type II toxin-antitoxin system PemK/MazF family toxin [Bacteroides sp.]MCM1445993.1 type II toxin-antitoxin system PemK/MazF family toxin [Prevotella sp.]